MKACRTKTPSSLYSIGMASVLMSQFLSALADNAILIIAIALVKQRGSAGLVPFLQEAFVIPFILLAPLSGRLADRFPKGRVMLLSNLLKLAGAVSMAAGSNTVIAYCLIGFGAALYSPAKYGILSQMVDSRHLVQANGLLEGSTVVAILLGVLLGGWLTDRSVIWGFVAVVHLYAFAVTANLLIPRLPAERPGASLNIRSQIADFRDSCNMLFSDRTARISLLGTSIFWGSGITLRLMLFAWAPIALHASNNQTPANLMGCVSLGIILGAVIAGAVISLDTFKRAFVGGILLGPIIIMLSITRDIRAAAFLMAAVGLCGGIFVVPLNAVLQERGHASVGAGQALAIQNFVENLAMLLFVGGYTAALSCGTTVYQSVIGFGLIILVSVGALVFSRAEKVQPVPD